MRERSRSGAHAPIRLWPQTRTTLPLTPAEPGDASHATVSATSTGRPPWASEFIRRPASRMASGIAAVMRVSMKPGATALIVACAGSSGASVLDHADHARLGRRVVRLAAVAGDPADRGDAHDPAAVATEQRRVDPLVALEVDGEHRVPPVLAHAGERAVAGDAGVVDDDVDAALGEHRAGAARR